MKKYFVIVTLAVFSFAGATSIVVAKDQDDKGPLSKITFIHYKKNSNPAKPGGGLKPLSSACYGYLSKGAKWKTAEDYVVNPTNNSGLSPSEVVAAMDTGIAQWEMHSVPHIFGAGSTNTGITYDGDHYDGVNSASFGNYPDSRVIAITTIWGFFGGAPQTRELVEWDMLFNERFRWGNAETDLTVMDLRNIATHELGHSAGMDDIYTTSCNQETMYGYSEAGDMLKRDLNAGDIKGIQALYY